MPFDLSPLRNTIARLREAIGFWQGLSPSDPLKPHLRSAVIQSFEFSYELSIRMTRRILIERAESADQVRDLSFNDLLRGALDAGLPMDLDAWRRWRELRNSTSHAYDEARAQAVALRTPDFAIDADRLLEQLMIINRVDG